jgi:hypothetical protein
MLGDAIATQAVRVAPEWLFCAERLGRLSLSSCLQSAGRGLPNTGAVFVLVLPHVSSLAGS